MTIKTSLILVILCFSCPFLAQKKQGFTYGAAINSCYEENFYKDPGIEVTNSRALGFYLNSGWQAQIDDNYIVYVGLRYGVQKSLFDVTRNGAQLFEFYYVRNQSLFFVFAPGVIINKKQRLFVTSGIGRFYQMNNGGGGVRAGRQYTYAEKTTLNSFDYRLGLKWQLKMFERKNTLVEVGLETSNIQYQATITIDTGYNNRPKEAYNIRYNVVIFYLGFMF